MALWCGGRKGDDSIAMTNPLPVPLPFQEKTYWCWSAVSKGLADFYVGGVSRFTQCSIATSVLNVGDCCNGAPCDVWQELTLPLTTVGHYVDPPFDCSQS